METGRRRGGRVHRLRALMADGKWRTGNELVRLGYGWRFGALLHLLRTGADGGPPLAIESECVRPGLWRYRCTGEGEAQPRPTRDAVTRLRDAAPALAEALRAAVQTAQHHMAPEALGMTVRALKHAGVRT